TQPSHKSVYLTPHPKGWPPHRRRSLPRDPDDRPRRDGDAAAWRRMMMSTTRAALVGAAVLAIASPVAAQSFPLECAQRDAQRVPRVGRQGEARDVPGDFLFEAFWTVKRARDACSEGRVVAGLALYDSIFKPSLAGLAGVR